MLKPAPIRHQVSFDMYRGGRRQVRRGVEFVDVMGGEDKG